jgi:hypothetical protein
MVCIKTPQGADSDDTMATTRDDTMGAARDDTMGAALRGRPNKAQHPPMD